MTKEDKTAGKSSKFSAADMTHARDFTVNGVYVGRVVMEVNRAPDERTDEEKLAAERVLDSRRVISIPFFKKYCK